MNTKILIGFLFCVVISLIVGLAIGNYMNNKVVQDTSQTIDSIDSNLEKQVEDLNKSFQSASDVNNLYASQILDLLNQTTTLRDEVKEWKDKYDRKGGGGGTRIVYLPTPGY